MITTAFLPVSGVIIEYRGASWLGLGDSRYICSFLFLTIWHCFTFALRHQWPCRNSQAHFDFANKKLAMPDKLGPILWTALALFVAYAVQTLRRWRYMRLYQFADFPQIEKPSLVWGHMAVLGKLFKRGDPRRHIGAPHILSSSLISRNKYSQFFFLLADQVLLEVCRAQGSPPVMLLDLRPLEWPMLVICNADVAEQITKASSRWSSSTPKSPTLRNIWHLTGKTSILTAEVTKDHS